MKNILLLTLGLVLWGCGEDSAKSSSTTASNNVNNNTVQVADNTATNATNQTADTTDKVANAPSVAKDSAPNDDKGNAEDYLILALGDSLTEGLNVEEGGTYPAQLAAYLQANGYPAVRIINAGISGDTSHGVLNRLDWVLSQKPKLTILTIGANDAMRGQRIEQIEQNIRDAITKIKASGSAVILGGMQIYDNLGEAYVNDFKAIYPRIAETMDVPLIPFFLEGVAADANLNQKDGIHPTAEGYKIIVANNVAPLVMAHLKQHYPK